MTLFYWISHNTAFVFTSVWIAFLLGSAICVVVNRPRESYKDTKSVNMDHVIAPLAPHI